MMRKKISFIKLIRLWGIVFLIALSGIIIAIDIVTSYRNFDYRVDKMRVDYLKQQKQMIKREVERVVDMINYEKAQSESLAKIHIKSIAYKVYDIVQNIYEQNRALRSDAEIKKMIDEKTVRDVAAAMLERCGYTVDFAVDGKEAMAKYISANKSGNSFDIVIMDLTIPGGMGGKEAVNKLLAIDSEAKVIVSSGYSTDPVMANYSEYGFKGRLVKPFQMKTLKTEICRVNGA